MLSLLLCAYYWIALSKDVSPIQYQNITHIINPDGVGRMFTLVQKTKPDATKTFLCSSTYTNMLYWSSYVVKQIGVRYPEKSIPLVQHFTDTSSQVKGLFSRRMGKDLQFSYQLPTNKNRIWFEYSSETSCKTRFIWQAPHQSHNTYITPDDCPIADWFFVGHVRFMGSSSNENHLKYFPLIVCFVTNLLSWSASYSFFPTSCYII